MVPSGAHASERTQGKTAWPEGQQRSMAVDPTVEYGANSGQGPSTARREQEHAAGADHSTIAFPPRDFSRPRRPLGQPEVTSLIAETKSENILLKHRAATLIQRYSGSRWREAQRTKWLIDVVCHIDRDYRQYIMEQEAEIAALHEQLRQTNGLQVATADSMRSQNEQLRQRCELLERQLRASHGELLDMRNRVAASEVALEEAEEAAHAAVEECQQLQQDIAALAEADASARKVLSNRSHTMREALVATRGRARQAAERSKRHRVEVAALLSLQREAAEADKRALEAQLAGTLQAADTLRGAATSLEVQRLQLELAAYKEPWGYMFRDKSPTRDPRVTKQLGLKQKSFNIAVPY